MSWKLLYQVILTVLFSHSTVAYSNLLVIEQDADGNTVFVPTCTDCPPTELGNITSDGSGGRQPLIRPQFPEDVGRYWKFFPPFQDPPATPSQNSVQLTSGAPLLLTLPQLAHFPTSASVQVEHSTDGNLIKVIASIEYGLSATATIFGPHEYLHSLGSFEPGDYSIELQIQRSDAFNPGGVARTTGYIDFSVVAVPEPASLLIALGGGLLLLCKRNL